MSQPDKRDLQRRLEELLDGRTPPAERDAVLRELNADPEMAAELRLQEQIDASLHRTHHVDVPNDAWFDALAAGAQQAQPAAAAAVTPAADVAIGRRVLVAAAGLAACAALAVAAWRLWPTPPASQSRPLSEAYQAAVDAGFEPEWRIADRGAFAAACSQRAGSGLALRELPDDVETVGLALMPSLSVNTLGAMFRVDGRPVIVFIDGADFESADDDALQAAGLKRFERRLGELTLHEVTPFDRPRVAEFFARPDAAGH